MSYNVLHDGDNLSDHDAICLKLQMPSVCYANTPTGVSYKNVCWERPSDSDILIYKGKLIERLKSMSVPWDALTCKSFMCKKHHNDIVTFHDCLIAVHLDVCNDHIPCISSTKRKSCLPGWNEHVETKRRSAIFWNNIWPNNGSPHSGVVAEIRRRTRLKYHYAVRYIKNNQDTITNQYMADAKLNNKARSFWTEVKKKLNGHNSKIFSVDSSTEKNGICNIFYGKYKSLYSSVPYNNKEMYRLQTDIESNVDLHCTSGLCYNNHSINLEDVYGAVKKLKVNKGDGIHQSFSNNIINAPHISYVYLALLFNSMLVHGVMPDGMLLGTIIPTVKNKRKSTCDSSNFRAITLSSILGKMFDNIILAKNSSILRSSDYQFGFKPKHSTVNCSFVLKEIAQYYNNKGSNVYCLLLDASQAFDRVHYIKLFKLLIDKGMCFLTARFLLSSYI